MTCESKFTDMVIPFVISVVEELQHITAGITTFSPVTPVTLPCIRARLFY